MQLSPFSTALNLTKKEIAFTQQYIFASNSSLNTLNVGKWISMTIGELIKLVP